MKIIVRVEHEDGMGMFTDEFNRNYTVENIAPAIDARHISFNNPVRDGLNRTPSDFCAYKSIEDIQKWIMPDEFRILFKHGYRVWLLSVSECQEGRDNILFKKENVISKKDISPLFILNQQ